MQCNGLVQAADENDNPLFTHMAIWTSTIITKGRNLRGRVAHSRFASRVFDSSTNSHYFLQLTVNSGIRFSFSLCAWLECSTMRTSFIKVCSFGALTYQNIDASLLEEDTQISLTISVNYLSNLLCC